MRRYYNIVDLQNNIVHNKMSASDITCLFGFPNMRYVSRYCNNQTVLYEKYRIIAADDDKKINSDSVYVYGELLLKEWDETVEYLRNKIVWCKEGNGQGRKIIL